MTTYAALLRGVNVGGHRKVPMAELRTVITELGYRDVRTYLQSGNAVFSVPTTAGEPPDTGAVAAVLGRGLAERFGFAVDLLVRDHAYLRSVVADCPFPVDGVDGRHLHVTYLSKRVGDDRLAGLDRAAFLPEEFRLGDRALYLYAPEGLGRSALAAALARPARWKGVVTTSRNWNTVTRLVEMTRD
ncbi:DUF1697 domain-containing protein [Streptomyces sp. NPDC049906]|uniref:DUF1697 domain-containing protein n=1 Tax=Streptomyces sp. NPDC049906 TaxID=3155656 RepID=UPI00343FC7E0